MSIGYAFLLAVLGLGVCGLMGVIFTQILSINFHFIAIELGLDATGLSILNMLDDMVKFFPVAILSGVIIGLLINSWRSKYEV